MPLRRREHPPMHMHVDPQIGWLMGGVTALLVTASAVTAVLKRRQGEQRSEVIANLEARVRAWWVMVGVVGLALAVGPMGSVLLFAAVSVMALREFIPLVLGDRADRVTMLWIYAVFTPLQYVLVATQWYGFFVVAIPVYAFVLLPAHTALRGRGEAFLERTAEAQWALVVCVYCVSHIPALLMLDIKGYAGQNAKLLLYLLIVAQLSDVLQYVWGKLIGRHKVAPVISPNKTVEGLWGGMLSATAVGAALWRFTPFTLGQAAGLSFLITVSGFLGGLVMSAIKRDRGVKDYGQLIEGHGGVMDRIDSLCFAAPIFFHVVRYLFA